MRFLPGSHRSGFVKHDKTDDSGNVLRDGQDMNLTPDQLQSTVVNDLKAGQCSMHHGKIKQR